jgi:hypothetical protein
VQAGPIRYLATVLMEVDVLPANWFFTIIRLILSLGSNKHASSSSSLAIR